MRSWPIRRWSRSLAARRRDHLRQSHPHDWVDISGGSLVPVEDVQRDYLTEILAIAREIDAPIVLAGIHGDAVIDVWMAEPSKISDFLTALAPTELRVAVGLVRRVRVVPAARVPEVVEHAGVDRVRYVEVFRRHHVGGHVVHGQASAIRIHFPRLDEASGRLVSPRYARAVTSLPLEDIDQLPVTEILGHRLPTSRSLARIRELGTVPETVDVVYTWVDGQDPAWLARRATYEHDAAVVAADGADTARFHSSDELRYSLRSVMTYLRGLGTVYLVTDQQVPDWLEPLGDRVRVVDHRDIFRDPSVLPTFNSHAIESQLHRIDGLSEHFLYLNDDVFLGRATTPSFYFDEYGRTRHFYSGTVTIPEGPVTVDFAGVDVAGRNAQATIEERFGVHVTRKFKHTPIALRRSVLDEIEREFPDVFVTTSRNRFRSLDDHAVAGSFYCHYSSVTGRGVPGRILYRYLNVDRDDFVERLAGSGLDAPQDSARPDAFCINSTQHTHLSDANRRALGETLRSIFPLPAPHER